MTAPASPATAVAPEQACPAPSTAPDADDPGATVGATSKDVDPGFGGGPERLGAGVADVAKQTRTSDPALQRGQQQKPA